MRLRPLLAIGTAVLLIGLLAFGLLSRGENPLAVGKPAPSTPVERLDGSGTGQLSDYRGKWVLLNFWASWCAPCEAESPAIEDWARQNEDVATVVGMNTLDATDDARAFASDLELSWEMLRDGDGSQKNDFGVAQLPGSFLIDPEGNIALAMPYPIDEKFLEANVTPLVGEAQPEEPS